MARLPIPLDPTPMAACMVSQSRNQSCARKLAHLTGLAEVVVHECQILVALLFCRSGPTTTVPNMATQSRIVAYAAAVS